LNQQEYTFLGQTNILISRLGVGTWAWGDRLFWGYGREYTESDVRAAFTTSLEAGINFFDTAEIYGQGRSERLLGKFASEFSGNTQRPIIIATKFFPYPWRLWKGSLQKALEASLRRLNMEQVHLYQIHWPFPPVPLETWASALADMVERGLTQAVGVSNYNLNQMRRAHAVLIKRGIVLASNQVEYSLLNRSIEFNGLLSLCNDLGITCIAYSPLAQGVLSGKYTPLSPPSGARARRYNRRSLTRIDPLLRLLREIGHAHGGKTCAQVALNWIICKGALPIPGAKNAQQAQENAAALGWRLSPEEVAELDKVSLRIHQER
jgi:aryl-alcohol dehydrogenase-like predicted oxidoreductase